MIYLDSAATTLQKPPAVAATTARAIRRMASPGRGGHLPAREAAQVAFACREAAADLFHVATPEQVVLTFNATHGLNIAIKSLVRPGSRVLISGYEHNAVTRPLHGIPNVELHVVRSPLFRPDEAVEDFRKSIDGVDVVICTHMSNVFGYILPISEIAALCQERGVPLIVDASQSAGAIPLDCQALGAAFVAMPGHKGLYGPQGTGLLLCGEKQMGIPLLEGGTGSASVRQEMPDFLPDRLEAGTHNVAGIAGLLEGLRFVRRRGVSAIGDKERYLVGRMAEGLEKIPGVELFWDRREAAQGGVLSFRMAGQDCELAGEALGDRGIAVRAGLHCAPLAHETAGTLDSGTVRVSVSDFNHEREVHEFLRTMRLLAG